MMAIVYFNNKFIGEVENPREFVRKIIEARRQGKIPQQVNVAYFEDIDTVKINLERGRLRRPLIVVKNGKPLLTKEHIEKLRKGELKWSDLVKMGIIEYLDADEESNAYIALSPDELTKEHTHLEIHPTVILGISASLVPYGEYNQAPKTFHGVKVVEQGLGVYALNFPIRMDTDVSIGWYPQSPIVETLGFEMLPKEATAVGQNVVIAILEYEGYNMDDAIVMNKASIERGLFRATYFRPYKTEELRYAGGMSDRIEVPPKDVFGYRGEEAYRNLEEDGIAYPEAEVEEGDVIIGKTSPPRFFATLDQLRVGMAARRDSSISVRRGERGWVDFVVITESGNGNRLVKVRVRQPRVPELGDKFSTRHGQKGVIGMIVPQEDMPFTASGIIPDIIFSPHSIPSRMTVGHLIETLAGKVGCLYGKKIDGTMFDGMSVEELRRMLLEIGFRDSGEEVMYNGITGEEYKVRIFVGNIYYMRLRHMAANKLHARSRGPVALLTRQPTEGKAQEGGLRLGEMEKDVLLAHGTALILKERWSSDAIKVPVCKKCGLIGYQDKYKGKTICPIHGEDSKMEWVEISYAFKLFLDELMSMGIYPKLYVGTKFGEVE